MRICFTALFLLVQLQLTAIPRLDSLLNVLDRTVEYRHEYTEQKEQTIAALKQQLSYTIVDEQQFHLTSKLFYLYSNYQVDSAFVYATERLHLAEKTGRKEFIAEANMNMAEALRTSGMYKETLELLHEIDRRGLDKYNKGYMLHLYHSLYMLMSEYSISNEEKKEYNALIYSYKDSILSILSEEDISYYLVNSTKNIMFGDYAKALSIMQKAYDLDLQRPMVTYTLSDIYKHLGNTELEKIYLAESAIGDLKQGVKEYISLQELAVLLFNEGDVDRAYLYLKISMEDAIFSNARLRTLEMSKMLPLINETYDIKMGKERTRLLWISIITIILAMILLFAISYIYRQLKVLSSIRKYQKKMNRELKQMNEELNESNSMLLDANLIKEEYIGNLFKICSTYIDKLESFRVAVNRKIKAGQIADLNKMTSSSSLVDDELKEFYKNFDSIFLNIYPTFVEDFNTLLEADEKIELKDNELLTPELRIFALVRLGVNDSVKIADFLHYSPQTIYNYRLRIRNKLAIPKDDFPVALAKIGILQS